MHLAWDWKSSAICDGQAFGRKQGVIQEKTLYYYFIHYYKKEMFSVITKGLFPFFCRILHKSHHGCSTLNITQIIV